MLSTAQLAQKLEVSRRTVLRDVEALSAAGVPVYCERGRQGGVRLLPGYHTDVSAFSADESCALFAALAPWGAQELGLTREFVSASRKLLAAIPDAHRKQSISIKTRIVIDPQGWFPRPEALHVKKCFAIVQRAVCEQYQLTIDYRSRSTSAIRTFTLCPHGLISAGSDWYLCASKEDQIRFFKVARIEDAAVLERPCPPDSYDVASLWEEHKQQFLAHFTPVSVTGRIRLQRITDAQEWAMRATFGEEHTTGWGSAQLDFLDELHAVTTLLRLGSDIYVESPSEIRTRLLTHIHAITRLYHGQ